MKTQEQLMNEAKLQLNEERQNEINKQNQIIEQRIIQELKSKVQVEEFWSEFDLNEAQLDMLKLWVSRMRPLRSSHINETEEENIRKNYIEYFHNLTCNILPPIEEQINNHPDNYKFSKYKGFFKKEPPQPGPKSKGFAWSLLGIAACGVSIRLLMWIFGG